MPILLERVRGHFESIPDPRNKNAAYPLADELMSGLAIEKEHIR